MRASCEVSSQLDCMADHSVASTASARASGTRCSKSTVGAAETAITASDLSEANAGRP
jgi:hypothetical protein